MDEMMEGDIRFVTRSGCELCGAEEKKVLVSMGFSDAAVFNFLKSYYQGNISKDILKGAKYEIVKCRKCGFIWQSQILNDQGMEKLYSEWISPQDSFQKKQRAGLPLYSGYAGEVEAIPLLVRREYPSEINVLDYGMGWGRWCLMAKAFGLNVTGVELSDERIRLCRKNDIRVVGDVQELMPESIHFINAEQVFEHIPQPRKTLETLAGRLAPGGVIRISVPNGRRVETEVRNPAWKAAKDAAHPLEHINIFTHRTLGELGQFAGMKVIGHPFLLNGKKGSRSYVRAILRKYYQQCLGTCLYFRKAA